MAEDNTTKFVRYLGSLEGRDFESAVCAHLERCFLDFQRIPDRPHGDGGLDGLSHQQVRAYCCYGPEQQPFKSNTRGLRTDIVRKFESDLRTLFELERTNGKLRHKETPELPTILGEGKTIRAVHLVVSVFNDHRVIGRLNTAFEKCKEASQCRFVAKDAVLSVWGPETLASKGAIDDMALLRVEQQALLARATHAAEASHIDHGRPAEFESKFSWLLERYPSRRQKIESIRTSMESEWSRVIYLDQELANTSAALHQSLERVRRDVVIEAQLRSVNTRSPFQLLLDLKLLLAERIGEQGQVSAELIQPLSAGELARLIGECHADWRN